MTGGCSTRESPVRPASSSNRLAPNTAVSTSCSLPFGFDNQTNIALIIASLSAHGKHCLCFRGLQQVRPTFRPPLRLGEQLHRCSEHTLLPALPLQRVRHGRRHRCANRRHAASCCAEVRASVGQLYRSSGPAAAGGASVCCTGETYDC